MNDKLGSKLALRRVWRNVGGTTVLILCFLSLPLPLLQRDYYYTPSQVFFSVVSNTCRVIKTMHGS
jgi:hypothetical protein